MASTTCNLSKDRQKKPRKAVRFHNQLKPWLGRIDAQSHLAEVTDISPAQRADIPQPRAERAAPPLGFGRISRRALCRGRNNRRYPTGSDRSVADNLWPIPAGVCGDGAFPSLRLHIPHSVFRIPHSKDRTKPSETERRAAYQGHTPSRFMTRIFEPAFGATDIIRRKADARRDKRLNIRQSDFQN